MRLLNNPMKKEHTVTVKEVSYMIDQAFCTCGWTSDRFWDGPEYAMNQWQDHVRKATGLKRERKDRLIIADCL